MSKEEKVYGVADRAWQCVVGCDPHMPCAPRCWARKTVARVVECQKADHPQRAEFFQAALTPDGSRWSGKVFLDEAHLRDPLRWRKPALIATGFHGDWGRLPGEDMRAILRRVEACPQHRFMLLSKQPQMVLEALIGRYWPGIGGGQFVPIALREQRNGTRSLPNATLGFSVMNQHDADVMRAPVQALAQSGWATHVWYEPAVGPVNWKGWEFIEWLIVGGESGPEARPFDVAWARSAIAWARGAGVKVFMKQVGVDPREGNANGNCRNVKCSTHPSCGYVKPKLKDRKGSDMDEWPHDIRVREMPEWR